jgi:sarcosine oxidase
VLDAADVMRRFPALRVPSGFVGVFQPEGGILAAEPAIQAQVALAKADGAQVRTKETARALEPRAGGVRIITDTGIIEAGQAIVAAGPWVRKLLPDFPVPLRVTRQVLGWFEPTEPAMFGRDRCPVFMIENSDGIFYGFPAGRKPGIKFAKHHHEDEAVDPAVPARPMTGADEVLLRAALAAHLPAANGRLLDAQSCLYTMAPDGDFILDRLPGSPDIIVASPCSGHGFKFAPVIGEALADLATTGATPHDIGWFSRRRLG